MNGYRHSAAAFCCGTVLAVLPGIPQVNAQSSASVPSLGAHTLLAQSEGFGTNPAVTAPITTQAHGSSLIVFNGGYSSASAPPVDSYANHWKQVGSTVPYGNGYGDRFDVKAYLALSAKGGAHHTVSIAKPEEAAGEISVPFIEILHGGVLQDVAQNYPPTSMVMTSGRVTTTGPAALVAVWWGDGGITHMRAVPNNGFAVIDSFLMLPDNSGVQCAVAFKQVRAAGTYDVSWTGVPVQGAILWLFAFQSG
ncbi:hypothetical protein ACVWWQ_000344 [Rhodanobacter sp. TND4EL1]